MTKKEVDKLRNWNFGKKPIQGYILLFPESLKYIKFPSFYDQECADKGKTIFLDSDENGFKINEDSLSFKTRKYNNAASHRETIKFKYIQKVRFYNYNY